MKQRALVLLSILGVVFMLGFAIAAEHATTGNPDDTASGTGITATGTDNTYSYKDLEGNLRPTVEGSDLSTTVGSVVGYSSQSNPPYPQYYAILSPGSTETWLMITTNEGNTDFNIIGTLSAVSYTAGDNWNIDIWRYGVNVGDSADFTLLDNDDSTLEVRITPAITETDAPDESYATFTIIGTTEYDNNSDYTGANDLTYGGYANSDAFEMGATVEAPIISLTRVATIAAPDSYLGSLDVHDPVPGSLITFTIVYTNEGTGKASNVAIIDRVPDNCVPYKISVQEPENEVSVEADAMAGEATWDIFYSDQALPSMTDYNNAADGNNWTYGNGGGTFTIASPYAELAYDAATAATMTWVKFETPSLEVGQDGTIQWSVYIK